MTNASAQPSTDGPLLVGAEQIRGIVDQMTAYFILERQLAHSGTCALVVAVFDGSGFYNLRFTDVKRETLSADGYQAFAGSVQVCEVVREDIQVSRNQSEDTYRRGKIWYARVLAGGQMVPVRMEYDTAFGVVKGYLAELHGRGRQPPPDGGMSSAPQGAFPIGVSSTKRSIARSITHPLRASADVHGGGSMRYRVGRGYNRGCDCQVIGTIELALSSSINLRPGYSGRNSLLRRS